VECYQKPAYLEEPWARKMSCLDLAASMKSNYFWIAQKIMYQYASNKIRKDKVNPDKKVL
jgi:hypothetical protein